MSISMLFISSSRNSFPFYLEYFLRYLLMFFIVSSTHLVSRSEKNNQDFCQGALIRLEQVHRYYIASGRLGRLEITVDKVEICQDIH